MKASEVDFHYPVLGFKFEEIVGHDGFLFRDFDSLTVSNAHELKAKTPLGMTFIAVDGRRWVVKSVRRLGPYGSILFWILGFPFGWNRTRLDYDLEVLPPVSLTDVQDRVCAIFKAFGKENDYNKEDRRETAKWIAGIRAASSIAEVAELTDWRQFQ